MATSRSTSRASRDRLGRRPAPPRPYRQQLRAQQTDLEALFFQLTENTNRNLGAGATAPAEHDAIAAREGANE